MFLLLQRICLCTLSVTCIYTYVCGCSVVVKKMFRFIREIVRGYLNFSSPISMNLSPSPKLLRGSVQVLVFCSKEFLLIYMYSNYCLKYRIYFTNCNILGKLVLHNCCKAFVFFCFNDEFVTIRDKLVWKKKSHNTESEELFSY